MRKQFMTNKAFKEIREGARLYPRKELDRLVDVALKRLHQYRDKKLAVAWSGGKDSIALNFIAEQAGIKRGVLGICNLEYPEYERWMLKHLPAGFDVVNTGQDEEWLLKNPDMLFPDSTHASRWFTIVQRKAQISYCRKHGIDLILVGRRKEDGNVTGSKGLLLRRDVGFLSPLYDWTHEQVFALIDAFSLPMPPIYDWPNGYVCGTHPWPARQHVESEEQGWAEVYSIDKSIVRRMSEYYDKARECIKRNEG
jgi:3'-phosphoadenosine 5'-phosphosulfate sulfotransferase (PAPS reductase)/FAD synthetase